MSTEIPWFPTRSGERLHHKNLHSALVNPRHWTATHLPVGFHCCICILCILHPCLFDETTSLSVHERASKELSVGTRALTSAYEQMLLEFSTITKTCPITGSPPHHVLHHIVTSGSSVSARSRRLSCECLTSAKCEFNHTLPLGIIQPSPSCWASPHHLVLTKYPGDWKPAETTAGKPLSQDLTGIPSFPFRAPQQISTAPTYTHI